LFIFVANKESSMKKNRLYTVTKANKAHLFSYGGTATQGSANVGINNSVSSSSKMNWGKAASTVGGTLLNTQGTDKLLDYADPLYYLAGSNESQVGNTLQSTGKGLFKTGVQSGNPWVMLAGGVAQGVGSLTNAAFGHSIENEDAVKSNTTRLNQYRVSDDSYESIQNAFNSSPLMKQDIGKVSNGWFTNKGTKKANKLTEAQNNAYAFATNSTRNAINNVKSKQNAAYELNYSAFGGPLFTQQNSGMGAIDYGFMSDYLAAKNAKTQTDNKITSMPNSFIGMEGVNTFAEGGSIHIKHPGRLTELKKRTGKTEDELWATGNPEYRKMITFARNARKWKKAYGGALDELEDGAPLFAFGGSLQSHGSDWSNGVTMVNTGGTHEENPYEGVKVGVDHKGMDNLVEEGEVIYTFPDSDFVYSNRITCPEELRKKYGIRGKKDLTFAEVAKRVQEESAERPNDPISKAGLEAIMQDLADSQERLKEEANAARAKAEFESMTPEQQATILAARQQAVSQQAAVPQEQPIPQAGTVPQEQPVMSTDGGNIHAEGGPYNTYGYVKGYDRGWFGDDGKYTQDYLDRVNALTAEELQKQFDRQYAFYHDDANKDTDRWKSIDEFYKRNSKYNDAAYKVTDEDLKDAIRLAQDYKPGYMHDLVLRATETVPEVTPPNIPQGVTTDAGTLAPNEPRVAAANRYWLRDPNGGEATPIDDYFEGVNGNGYTWAQLHPDYTSAGDGIVREPVDVDGIPTTYTDYYFDPSARQADVAGVSPRTRWEGWRYAGLFGPAIGLGMQAAGIGKPDYADLDAAVSLSGREPIEARVEHIGNYMKYRPFDRDYYLNKANATNAATRRAILNSGAGASRNAALLASDYNAVNNLGDLARQAEEYNLAQRQQVAQFNRETDQYNATADNNAHLQYAQDYNRNRQYAASLALRAAAEKLNGNAEWYNGIYGNISGLANAISNIGKENAAHNMVARSAADGIYGSMNPDTGALASEVLVTEDDTRAGRRKNRKNKKKGGLTY